jgi:N-methylhydantoinase B/oxoprolinase/acetone carboxylase alpha subunit
MTAIDPVTLAVVQSGLSQVCNEMDLAFVRAAFSPVISEALDRSDGIYHRDDGALIAQGDLGLPVFVGTMQFGTREVIKRARDLKPGDMYIVNDPYLGGTHLMDVRFVRPFFYQGEIFAWLANTGHWPDTGGAVPGGFSANATEVEQEGLRLPPVKLFKGGEMDEEILSIILSNIRIADQRIGDIKAQAAALTVGERRFTALLDRYGKDVVEACIAELRRRAEQQMRAKIATIPDGDYHGVSYVDSDGVVDAPLKIDMRINKRDTDLHFDMSGSSPPCLGPMNSVIATTRSSIYLAIKHIFPEVPLNAGTFAPLHIADPAGTFLYATYPRPVSGCAAEVSQRIAEAVFAALTPALPDQLFAAPAGTSGNFALGGDDPKTGRSYVLYLISGGGYGGSEEGDGLSNGHLEDDADRSGRAALSGPDRAICAARGLGRRRRAPGRLRGQLHGEDPPRRGARIVRHGPRALWPAGRARRQRRRPQQGARRTRRPARLCPATPVEGPRYPGDRRRPHSRLHPRRRRLRRPPETRPAGRAAGSVARLLHGRRSGRPVRCRYRRRKRRRDGDGEAAGGKGGAGDLTTPSDLRC